MTNDTSSTTSSKNIFARVHDYLAGGFNMPTKAQIDNASNDPGTDQGMPRGFFSRLGVWIGGGYNLPTKTQVDNASSSLAVKTSYSTGLWGWLSGGFNLPIDPLFKRR